VGHWFFLKVWVVQYCGQSDLWRVGVMVFVEFGIGGLCWWVVSGWLFVRMVFWVVFGLVVDRCRQFLFQFSSMGVHSQLSTKAQIVDPRLSTLLCLVTILGNPYHYVKEVHTSNKNWGVFHI
jgi:hypothetical protein